MAINALERRLQKQLEDVVPGRDGWSPPHREPHVPTPEDHETQGALSDIVLEFVRDDLVAEMTKDAVKAAVAYLVWAVVSHLKSQPDPEQTVELRDSRTHVKLTANGLTEEEVARAVEQLAALLTQAAERRRHEELPPSNEEPPPSNEG